MTQDNNGNDTAIEIVRKYLDEGKTIPLSLKDALLFGSLVSLADGQTAIRKSVRGMEPWVRIFKWMLLIVGPLVVGLLFGMITHTFTWPF